MKYTVIIPTMWVKPHYLSSMLQMYTRSLLIKEVIIIDNNPNENKLSETQGVRVLTKGGNIYVNPAWNWGVSEAKGEKIIIANDDIYVKDFYLLLTHVDNFLKPGMVIGCGEACYGEKGRDKITIKNIEERNIGWGVLMFMYKESYKIIPDALKIWFGDDILFKNNRAFAFDGVVIDTEMSSTIQHYQLHDIIGEDQRAYEELGL